MINLIHPTSSALGRAVLPRTLIMATFLALSPGLVSPIYAATPSPVPAIQAQKKTPQEASLRRYALVIGANQGGTGRQPLKYAGTDAKAFARVMTEMGGVAPEDQTLLLDPTRAGIDSALEALGSRIKKAGATARRSEVILYYSGHSDETGIMLGKERWNYPEIRRALEGLSTDVRIAILDSCASGALIRTKGGVQRPPFLMDASSSVKGYAFLTSSAEDEAAQESERLKGSFFTQALVAGLRGAADSTRDGKVTLHEAYQFAFHNTLDQTRQTAAGPQHPGYDIRLVGSGDLVLTDLRSTGAGVELDAELVGDLYIRDADGHLVAELKKGAGQTLDLAFAPGNYRVTLVTSGQVLDARLTLKAGERVSLTETRFQVLTPERTARRGTELPGESDFSGPSGLSGEVIELHPGETLRDDEERSPKLAGPSPDEDESSRAVVPDELADNDDLEGEMSVHDLELTLQDLLPRMPLNEREREKLERQIEKLQRKAHKAMDKARKQAEKSAMDAARDLERHSHRLHREGMKEALEAQQEALEAQQEALEARREAEREALEGVEEGLEEAIEALIEGVVEQLHHSSTQLNARQLEELEKLKHFRWNGAHLHTGAHTHGSDCDRDSRTDEEDDEDDEDDRDEADHDCDDSRVPPIPPIPPIAPIPPIPPIPPIAPMPYVPGFPGMTDSVQGHLMIPVIPLPHGDGSDAWVELDDEGNVIASSEGYSGRVDRRERRAYRSESRRERHDEDTRALPIKTVVWYDAQSSVQLGLKWNTGTWFAFGGIGMGGLNSWDDGRVSHGELLAGLGYHFGGNGLFLEASGGMTAVVVPSLFGTGEETSAPLIGDFRLEVGMKLGRWLTVLGGPSIHLATMPTALALADSAMKLKGLRPFEFGGEALAMWSGFTIGAQF